MSTGGASVILERIHINFDAVKNKTKRTKKSTFLFVGNYKYEWQKYALQKVI